MSEGFPDTTSPVFIKSERAEFQRLAPDRTGTGGERLIQEGLAQQIPPVRAGWVQHRVLEVGEHPPSAPRAQSLRRTLTIRLNDLSFFLGPLLGKAGADQIAGR